MWVKISPCRLKIEISGVLEVIGKEQEGAHRAPHHSFRARFYSGLFLFFLSFVGVILTEVYHDGGFTYWRYVIPIFALVGLFLSWYLRHKKESYSIALIWHELLHWAGLLFSVYLVAELLHIGILSRFAASLVLLTMLALTLFLAGIYIEYTFGILGLVMGGFVITLAFLAEYFYLILIPLLLLGIALLFFLSRKKKRRPPQADTPTW